MPPVEYDPAFTRIHLYCNAKKVRSFEILINYAAKIELKDEIVERLSNKFGTPALTRTASGMLTFPVSNVRVRFRHDVFMKDATIDVPTCAQPMPMRPPPFRCGNDSLN